MVSPMTPDGSLDLDNAASLAYLVDYGHDSLWSTGRRGSRPPPTRPRIRPDTHEVAAPLITRQRVVSETDRHVYVLELRPHASD